MAVDKKIKYAIQGGGPNYLGKQKMVTAPKKWKSSPTHPEAHLAYITDKEQDLLIKKDLYGSLKGKPNRGPAGIVSLQGDLGGYQGGGGGGSSSGGGGGGGGGSPGQQAKDKHMKDILTGKVTTGQTQAVSDKVRQGAVPEYAFGPDGKRTYIGSAYKDTGQRGFLGRLFSGANKYGYAPTHTKGLRFNPNKGRLDRSGRYEFDDSRTGQTKPGWAGRILGGLSGFATGIPFVGGAIGSAIDRGKGIFKRPSNYFAGLSDQQQALYNQMNLNEDNELTSLQGDSAWKDGTFNPEDLWSTQTSVNNDIVPLEKPLNVNQGSIGAGTGIDNVTDIDEMNQYFGGAADGGRAGYAFGEEVEQETDFIEGPQGGEEFQETVVEGQEQPSREQLEALSMEIFQLPLEELDEQQLLVVYQEAMQGQPMEEAVQEDEVQYAAQGGLAGLL